MSAIGSIVLVFALGAASQEAPPSDAQRERAPERATVEVPAPDDPFERRPSELPRAEPGHWDGLFAKLASDEGAGDLIPQSLRDRQALAEALYQLRDYRATLNELYGTLEIAPDFPPALIVLGTALFRLRRYGDAAVALERFVEVAPDQLARTQVLGHCHYSLGDYEAARDHYQRVIAAGTDSPGAVRGLALALWRLGDVEAALELLDATLAREPDHYETLIWKAQLLFEEEEFAAALHLAERAQALAPHEPRPLFLQSRCLFELERDDEAEARRERWRELDALTQEVRRLEGRIPFERDPYGLAIELAQLCRSTRDVETARDALSVAERTRPDEVGAVDFRLFALEVLWDIGDREGAAVAARALEIDGAEDARAWKRLEQYFAQTRDRRRQIEAGERWRRLSDADGD
ncbi:Tetratricopeptide repeat protein [Planctomycetes bacterium Pla163]|uniref:Tetratricopeptide repeat protein n=1 Tax=Rohdeia mirabilis TaxID=2528008 RepID=A0A518CWX7_9BACT|nr:Tetratricopeptide repeat protein [Planctomycetes bacterium Pla163]